MKLFYSFSLLLFVVISACSAETEEQVPEQDSKKVYVEDAEEKADILKEFQAAEEEIYSMSMGANVSQVVTGEDGVSIDTEVSASSDLILDPLAARIDSEEDTYTQNTELSMHLNEDATYLSANPSDEDPHWQKFTGEEHEEILAGIEKENEAFLFVNYDVLLEYTDEFVLALVSDDEGEADEHNFDYYELTLGGDSNIYHELINDRNMDEPDQFADVDDFNFNVTLDKDTKHPIEIYSTMYGTLDMEGEVLQVEEIIFTHVMGTNNLEEGDLKIPTRVEMSAETDEEDEE
ncbi:DUF6612 family protein [Oceanobacillus jeddahense]|uniref:DUF6612 family protein n=1 Tax=Oceanobacillus jeddahense TaxID=1462527 RepID=UPI000595BFCD|nr:DUF6612 family protein [Oceanobacillus jeddahense]